MRTQGRNDNRAINRNELNAQWNSSSDGEWRLRKFASQLANGVAANAMTICIAISSTGLWTIVSKQCTKHNEFSLNEFFPKRTVQIATKLQRRQMAFRRHQDDDVSSVCQIRKWRHLLGWLRRVARLETDENSSITGTDYIAALWRHDSLVIEKGADELTLRKKGDSWFG